MAAKKKFTFSIFAEFKDNASRGIKSLQRRVLGFQAGMGRGLFGGFARGPGAGVLARPGGVGGFFAGITQGAAGIALLPARIKPRTPNISRGNRVEPAAARPDHEIFRASPNQKGLPRNEIRVGHRGRGWSAWRRHAYRSCRCCR